jgi:DNA-binding NarL/FixJ family response regulator
MHNDKEYIRRAVEVGAAGYLLKDSDSEELERALREVAQGGNYLSPEVSRHLVIAYKKPPEGTPYPGIQLTRRQLEVLKLIAEGKTTKSIARSLGISAKTVEAHRTLLMERLGIFDIAGLVRYAFRTGIITTEK